GNREPVLRALARPDREVARLHAAVREGEARRAILAWSDLVRPLQVRRALPEVERGHGAQVLPRASDRHAGDLELPVEAERIDGLAAGPVDLRRVADADREDVLAGFPRDRRQLAHVE